MNTKFPAVNRSACLALISIALTLAPARSVAAIGFDGSFGVGGIFTTSFTETADASSSGAQIFIQPSGRIIVFGTHSQQGTSFRTTGTAIVGLTAGGIVDPTFGLAGKALYWSAAHNRYHENTIMLSDGSMLIFYHQWESVSSNRPVVEKLNPNGLVDPAFTPSIIDVFPNETSPILIATSATGKIYVVVRSFTFQFALVRLNPDGTRDTTFGPNGVRSLNLNRFSDRPELFAMQELADGRLLLAGSYYLAGADTKTFVVRLNPDTTIDRSFGMQGATRIAFPGGGVQGAAMKLLPDGRILIGGAWVFLGSTTILARLTSRGRLDMGFGTDGFARASFDNTNGINSIAIASDGKLIVTGITSEKTLPATPRLFVIKYSASGIQESALITGFIANQGAGATDIVLQADGKILISGFTRNANNNYQMAAARFVP